MAVEKYGWEIQKKLFAQINQDSTFYTLKNSKTSKHNFKIIDQFAIIHMNDGECINYLYPTEPCRRYLSQVEKHPC